MSAPQRSTAAGTAASAPVLNPEATVNPEMTGIEAPTSAERDARGLSYIANLVALYLLFAFMLVVVAWFGIFSEA